MAEDKRLRTYWIDKAKEMNLPYLFGYYAWLINEGTGAGETFINDVNIFKKDCSKKKGD